MLERSRFIAAFMVTIIGHVVSATTGFHIHCSALIVLKFQNEKHHEYYPCITHLKQSARIILDPIKVDRIQKGQPGRCFENILSDGKDLVTGHFSFVEIYQEIGF